LRAEVPRVLDSREPLRIRSFGDAIDSAPMGPLQWKIFVFAALGIFMDGYDFFIVAAALPLIDNQFHPAPAVLGLVGAAATLGAVAGGTILGRYADVLGRRKMAMITMILFAGISVVSGFAWNVVALIVIRFALGAAIGADYPTGAAFVSEFMPIATRTRLLFASLSFQAIGAVAGAYLGLELVHTHNPEAWRWMFVAGFVPAVAILLLRGQLPESPRWLYCNGRFEEMKRVMQALLQRPVVIEIASGTEPPQLPFRALFSRHFVGRTLFASVPWFCMDVALYGMSLFSPIVLAGAGFGHAKNTFWSRDIHGLRGALELDLLLVLGFVLGILLVKRAGVLRMQMFGFGGMIVGLALVALGDSHHQAMLLFAGYALFNVFVNAGPNGTTYIAAAVTFPTTLRASGAGLATGAGKIGASLGIFMMPVLQSTLGLTGTVVIVACVTLVGLLVTVALREQYFAGSRLALRGEAALTEPVPA
jgi:MFS family permease